jgi:hypothetical protein
MTNTEAIEILKNEFKRWDEESNIYKALTLAITALEGRKFTEEEVGEWNIRKKPLCLMLSYKDYLLTFLLDHNLLAEKVKRWKWTNGTVTTNEWMTEEELKNTTTYKRVDHLWGKVEGSEVCEWK